MTVLFVADAGAEVGGGHVMRCLTLASALQRRGLACAFAAGAEVGAILDRFAPATIGRAPPGTGAAAAGARLVVFDHYRLAARDHRVAAEGRPVLVIDDLADRPLRADLVLDMGADRRAEDYAGRVPPGVRLLIGPRYALVRRGFVEARERALARRGGPVRSVLAAMGLTDVGGITRRVTERLMERPDLERIEVVVGEATESFRALTKRAAADPRLRLHALGADMVRLMSEADAAVGAGGSTTWERCVLGLPSLTAVLADNQRPNARALEAMGAALVCDTADPDFEAAFAAGFDRLAGDAELRRSLSRQSAALCDGEGAERVADACLDLIRS